MNTMDQLTKARYWELYRALSVVIDSREIFEELENANYHSVTDFLMEVRDSMCVHNLGPEYEQHGEVVRKCVKCKSEIYLGETWE